MSLREWLPPLKMVKKYFAGVYLGLLPCAIVAALFHLNGYMLLSYLMVILGVVLAETIYKRLVGLFKKYMRKEKLQMCGWASARAVSRIIRK